MVVDCIRGLVTRLTVTHEPPSTFPNQNNDSWYRDPTFYYNYIGTQDLLIVIRSTETLHSTIQYGSFRK